MDATTTPLPAYPHCAVCKSEEDLLCCTGCWVIHYCNITHQTEHWTAHQTACTETGRTRGKLERRTDVLKHRTPNPFKTLAGRFWIDRSTHDFLRAKAAYINAVCQIETRAALQTAVDHSLAFLRLCHTDELMVRSRVPALLLRLDKLQEAFDFMSFWHNMEVPDSEDEERPVFDFNQHTSGLSSSQFLDVRGADVFDHYHSKWESDWADLVHAVSMCLLHVRLMVELRTFQSLQRIKSKLPDEVMDRIKMFAVSSVPWLQREDMLATTKRREYHWGSHVSEFEDATDRIFTIVDKRNEHYWDALAEPEEHLQVRREALLGHGHVEGSVEEMQLALQQTYQAWVETPGAMAWLRQRV